MIQRPTYKLLLRPEPGPVLELNELRRLLKVLLRTYGLRCLEIVEVKAEEGLLRLGGRDNIPQN